MKGIIIGASGLVGSYLWKIGKERGWDLAGTYHKFAQPGLVFLPLTEPETVRSLFYQIEPKVIFLPAFLSNADYCEQHLEETYQINVVGCLNVIKTAQELGSQLVFYSSDYVFDGESGPYRETNKPNPICVYGKQKLELEQKITEILDNYLILRITVVYGWEMQEKNFVSRLLKSLAANQIVKVPQDQIGSPTLVDDIAEASYRLVETGATGIFHTAGSDVISRYDFALEVAKVFELPNEHIIPISTPDLRQAAPRPLKAGMICDRLTDTIGWRLSSPHDGLSYLKSNGWRFTLSEPEPV
jgi:dTDP-4-dehydrorhamnose reductase